MIRRPNKDECAQFFHNYVKEVPDQDIFQVLSEQQEEVARLFQSLNKHRALFRYAEKKWSIKEVLGHMIDAERVFSYRAMCIARSDSGPLPAMDENHYVENGLFDMRPLASLSHEYYAQRTATLALFRSFSAEVALRRGIAGDSEFTVRVLAYIIAGHERHHLNVLRERYSCPRP